LAWQQNYAYDGFNRLTTVQETLQSASPALPSGTPANNWNAANGYDIFGNRAETASYSLGLATPTGTAQFNASTNRLAYQQNGAAMPPDAYDAAGNLTDDPAFLGTMEYDVEGHQAQYTSGANVATYTYDGEGRRVSKTLQGTTASTTTYVYDARGMLAAEYSTASPGDSGTTYLLTDHLGSTRLVTTASGSPLHRFDYGAFGEELSSLGLGNRNLMASYNLSSVPTVKFTGKERDAETGLDFFGARYFSGAQGRFTNPDPLLNAGNPGSPQTWNRYAYVSNNPLVYTDPTGLYQSFCGDLYSGCGGIVVDGAEQITKGNVGGNGIVACPGNVCSGWVKNP
jgi:RHS repeat-associated protein